MLRVHFVHFTLLCGTERVLRTGCQLRCGGKKAPAGLVAVHAQWACLGLASPGWAVTCLDGHRGSIQQGRGDHNPLGVLHPGKRRERKLCSAAGKRQPGGHGGQSACALPTAARQHTTHPTICLGGSPASRIAQHVACMCFTPQPTFEVRSASDTSRPTLRWLYALVPKWSRNWWLPMSAAAKAIGRICWVAGRVHVC